MQLKNIIDYLNTAGEISKNLLAIGALVTSIWAVFVIFNTDAPMQRLVDITTGARRISTAHGWVWLGEGANGKSYKFAMEKGEWETVNNFSLPKEGAVLRSLDRANVRDDAGPWGNELSYFVTGDCVKVVNSKIVYQWVWVKVTPHKCQM